MQQVEIIFRTTQDITTLYRYFPNLVRHTCGQRYAQLMGTIPDTVEDAGMTVSASAVLDSYVETDDVLDYILF